MPKRKPPRSQRRGRSRQLPPPPLARPAPAMPAPVEPDEPLVTPASPSAPIATAPAPRVTPARSLSRFTARDYSYVRRELVRIAILAVLVLTTLVVLSFFLP